MYILLLSFKIPSLVSVGVGVEGDNEEPSPHHDIQTIDISLNNIPFNYIPRPFIPISLKKHSWGKGSLSFILWEFLMVFPFNLKG